MCRIQARGISGRHQKHCGLICVAQKKEKKKKKASGPRSKICALKPDILLYPPGARYIKEPPPNLHRIYTSEESRGAHEIFFLFSCIQIDTYIKQLKHTSVIFYGAGSCLAEDEGITGTGFGELQRRHGVVPNIVIKSSSARMLSKLKCSFPFLFFHPLHPQPNYSEAHFNHFGKVYLHKPISGSW